MAKFKGQDRIQGQEYLAKRYGASLAYSQLIDQDLDLDQNQLEDQDQGQLIGQDQGHLQHLKLKPLQGRVWHS